MKRDDILISFTPDTRRNENDLGTSERVRVEKAETSE